MAPTLRTRRASVVVVVSSSSESDERGEVSDEDAESGDSSAEGSSSSVYEVEDDDEEADEHDSNDEEDAEADEEEEEEEEEEENGNRGQRMSSVEDVCDKISALLRGGKDLGKLRLEECRVYLRMHKLRITGKKAVCIQRIHEYWRIKGGNAENLYPISSFTINCTGDVCKGDVILFRQRVYEKFDIVTRGANVIGKRTIAGRVVKESYGAAKQQHTFTVEVLWSKGVKRLPALFPLLVKGRNLYRLKTFRRPWVNEAERSVVLSEKHKRGATARHVRSISKLRSANRGSKSKASSSFVSTTARMQKAHKTNKVRRKTSKQQSKARTVNSPRVPENAAASLIPDLPPSRVYPRNRNHQFAEVAPHHVNGPPEVRGSSNVGPLHGKGSIFHPYYHDYLYPQRKAHHIHNHLPSFHPSFDQFGPATAFNVSGSVSIPFAGSRQQYDPLVLARNPYASDFQQNLAMRLVRRHEGFVAACVSPGCQGIAAHGCVVSSCYSCCRRTGRQCYRHRN